MVAGDREAVDGVVAIQPVEAAADIEVLGVAADQRVAELDAGGGKACILVENAALASNTNHAHHNHFIGAAVSSIVDAGGFLQVSGNY